MNFHLLLPLALVPAVLLGQVFRRAGMPVVVGQISAGVLLGPAVLGLVPGEMERGGAEGNGTFFEFAQIGLCALLFKIGLETQFRRFLGVWRPATVIAAVGMVLPMALGWATALALGWDARAAIFTGAALTATSIGVTAAVLEELGAQKERESHLIIGAAVVDDIAGLVLLSTIVAVVTPGEAALAVLGPALLKGIGFLVLAALLGPLFVGVSARLGRWSHSRTTLFAFVFSYLMLMTYSAEKAGLAMIIGAYAGGLAIAAHPKREELEEELQPFIGIFTPLFFILIGTSIDFSAFNFEATWAALVLLAGAVVGKMAAPLFLRREPANRLAVGSGMVPRGEVGFVFAQTGLAAGVLAGAQFSVLALVLAATTVAGPLLLRSVWRRKGGRDA